MTRTEFDRTSPSGSAEHRALGSAREAERPQQDDRQLARDMFALAGLPAMWLGASPRRIGESLVAALDATIRPEMVYFRVVLDGGGAQDEVVELAHLARAPLAAEATQDLGERLVAWSRTHDPGELLVLSHPRQERDLRCWVQDLGHHTNGGVLAVGFAADDRPSDGERMLLNMCATQAIVACRNNALQRQTEAAREEAQALHAVTRALAAELDLESVLQWTTDAARQLTAAAFAAFFYNADDDERGEHYTLYTLSGAPREAFDSLGMPRNTPIFEPTFRGRGVVRIDDVLSDPRYGTMPPHWGLPAGHLPVRSYLAVSVTSRSGEVLGGLFCAHPEPGTFGERAERVVLGIARQAAVAIDNARLFARAEEELRQRERAEVALRHNEAQLRADIADRERVEQALRDSEERYRQLAELLPVAVYAIEAPLGTISYFNGPAAEAWGRTPRLRDPDERFCGSLRLYRPDGTLLPHEECPMAAALRDGLSFRNEEVVVERPDGSRVSALVNIDPIHGADGAVVGAINVLNDITAHKQAEHELREQKENLETLLETLPVGVLIALDPECRRIVGNRAASELLRMPQGSNLSRSAPDPERPGHFRVTRDGRPLATEELPVPRAARGEVVEAEEVWIEFLDGAVVHALVSARPLYDPSSRPRGAVASIMDISNLKQAESALRDADRRKDEFLAILAHELRNPLAPIRSALELLRQAEDDVGVLRTARDRIERQVSQLIRLVDDLLDVSRITRDRLEIRKTAVELSAAVQQALDTCRPVAEAERQVLRVSLPQDPIHLHADPVRLTQVFSNLIHNACKYSPQRGTIDVIAVREGAEVIVSVEDQGIGIPAARLESVFEMFAQEGHAMERSRGGLGIGLTLVKRLVELHEGSVVATSDGLGKGSSFVVRLPIGAPPEAAASPSSPPAQGPAAGRRILIVDDNRDAADLLSMLLEEEGHETSLAYDGEEALRAAEAFGPDLVLLDLGLPKLSGYDVCRRIRAAPWGERMVVVALSGWGREDDRRQTREAGFDDHLVKPVSQETLAGLLERFPTTR